MSATSTEARTAYSGGVLPSISASDGLTASAANWKKQSQLDENVTLPEVKVVYAHMLVRNGDGTEVREPLYAFTERKVREEVERDYDVRALLFGKDNPKLAEAKANRIASLLGELERLQAEYDRIHEQSGLAALTQLAREYSYNVVDELTAGIVNYKFEKLADVRLAAAYILKCIADGEEGFDHETMTSFLENVGQVPAT